MKGRIASHRTLQSRELGARLAASLPQPGWRTRFAPAPTGHLHLGHVVNALHVWGIAEAYGGDVLLRVEDHDATRCRPAYEEALYKDLAWLGFASDGATTRQSDNIARYTEAISILEGEGLVYPCTCTRSAIARNASANIEHAGELRYPGTCAAMHLSATDTPARRFRISHERESFSDILLGEQHQHPSKQCGDVLVRDRLGQFTYQFAVVVDDADQHIDVIIRGHDLLSSTGRQFQIARALGRKSMPLTLHHALIMRPDGLKLSKSLGDSGVGEMRCAGIAAADVLGRAAHMTGLLDAAVPLEREDVAELFRS